MYGDFSRFLDSRPGQYSAVLAQQGRLLLDSDVNELQAIVLDYMRRLTTDLLGPFAGPAHRSGFQVELVVEDKKLSGVRLTRGHYYVHGLRCEAPRPQAPGELEFGVAEHEAPFVVYMVVCEQSVSAIQAPELVEPALGVSMIDRSRRNQVRWRPFAARQLPRSDVDLTSLSREKIIDAFHDHNSDARMRPRLGARAEASPEPDQSPSTVPAAAPYRGVENQLYRVEVHRGGSVEDATFKFSRDNGCVEIALDTMSSIDTEGQRIAAFQTTWQDARRGLQVGDWVELIDDYWMPLGSPSPLLQIRSVSLSKREVALADSHQDRRFDAALHPLLRRWDQDPDVPAPSQGIPVADATGYWYELEDGVQVQFAAQECHYERGDFWLIPARTATRGVLWPQSDEDEPSPLAQVPHGPLRYRAPLALAKSLTDRPVDLRTRFQRVPECESDDDHPPTPANVVDQANATAIRPPAVRFRLRSVGTFASGMTWDLGDGEVTVGRGADQQIRLDHPEVSRHHAKLVVAETHLTIEDAGSGNGTFVNDERITASTELKVGDGVRFGGDEVQVKVEEP